MPKIEFLNPISQPTGQHRLIDELKTCFQSDEFESAYFSVAFVRSGALLRLKESIDIWKGKDKEINSIFGIDHLNTSVQALWFALKNFNQKYILHLENSHVTFHPKFYLFVGEKKAVCYYGSHNLTVGGLETNFEGGVKIEMYLPADQEIFKDAFSNWDELVKYTLKITPPLIIQLLKDGLVIDESSLRKERKRKEVTKDSKDSKDENENRISFPKLLISPPSPFPKSVISRKKKKSSKKASSSKSTTPPKSSEIQSIESENSVYANGLIIQIKPHHNGEVFLSKIAVNQNPDFFNFPFPSKTEPKKKSNPSYPLYEPPVLIRKFDSNGKLLGVLGDEEEYLLYMVFYELKSEIRITITKPFIRDIPEFSILYMYKVNTEDSYVYKLDIYFPKSEMYNKFLSSCNQKLPSGGKTARRMGWL